jgi:hypothetical protein
MKNFFVGALMLIVALNVKAQSNEQIINEVLYDLFDYQEDTVYLEQSISKTYFEYDSAAFENATGFKVPQRIVSSWVKEHKATVKSSGWNQYELNRPDILYIGADTIKGKKPYFKCLSDVEADSLLHRKNKAKIYNIGNILFDDKRETAIFSFTMRTGVKYYISEIVMIRKIFERWIVVTRFEFSMV